jgi:hypothetical protein
MGQSNQLWAVEISDNTDRNRTTPFGNLWILASDAETASRKTKRWMKQNDYVGWKITSVESHGEIDVF